MNPIGVQLLQIPNTDHQLPYTMAEAKTYVHNDPESKKIVQESITIRTPGPPRYLHNVESQAPGKWQLDQRPLRKGHGRLFTLPLHR